MKILEVSVKALTKVGAALFCVAMLTAQTLYAEETTRLRIGILDLENLGSDKQKAAKATEILAKLVAEQGMVEVYAQDRLAKALVGIGRSMPGHCRDPRCVLDLGGMINLDRMIYGEVDASDKRCAVHLFLMDIAVRVQIGEVSIDGESGDPMDSVLAAAVAMLHGRVKDKGKYKPYRGPEIHNEKQMLYASGGLIAAGLIWGLVNYSVGKEGTPLPFENRDENLSGLPSSADQIPMFARPAALANAYVAASDDAYGVLYNPAGMAWVSGPEAIVGYQYRFGFDNIAASYVNKATREIGFGQAFLYSGDREGLLTETYFVSAVAYKLNRIFSFVRPISLGLNLKMVSQKVTAKNSVISESDPYADFAVSGASFGAGIDLGLITEFSEQIRYGLLLRDVPVINHWRNHSTGDQYNEALATMLHMGGTYQAGYTTFLICEGQIPIAEDQRWKMAGAIEQELFRVMYARLGLQKEIQPSASMPTDWKITWGFGLKVNRISLDASHEYNTIGMFDVLNISFRVRL
jgi:hypothetical protein